MASRFVIYTFKTEVAFLTLVDASMFHCVEAWVSNPNEPFTTHYLAQIELYQRHMTTAAFKLAGGIDATSSISTTKPSKRGPVAPVLVAKITKAFLDSIYAILDGMVLLVSNEPPLAKRQRTEKARYDLDSVKTVGPNDSVRFLRSADLLVMTTDCSRMLDFCLFLRTWQTSPRLSFQACLYS